MNISGYRIISYPAGRTVPGSSAGVPSVMLAVMLSGLARLSRRLLRTALFVMTGAAVVVAARAEVSVSELKTYSLEELMGMEVTSVSRKPEPFYETAGAVGVLTGYDIKQTGARSLADALRYAPGMQVARVDGRTWAVTARGFNASESNKLLVLMDGRTVYTPLFSGVFWDVQNTFFPDIDRIEVIRGPGATMWGANAVNGVVSITTKDARYTQGGLVTAGIGTEEKAFAGVRYGGEVPGKFFYRVYAQSARRDDLINQSGTPSHDDWSMNQVGFRIDTAMAPERGGITAQGDYYRARVGAVSGSSYLSTPVSGGDVILRAHRPVGEDGELTSQFYFDYVSRSVYRQYGEERYTYDFDTQIRFTPWQHHEVVAGFDVRSSDDNTAKDTTLTFVPDKRTIDIAGMFVQDEIRWHDNMLGLILGSKFEYHESVGLEIQPSARLALRLRRSTFWASVSRAVRTPSRYDDDVRFPSPTRPQLLGSHAFESESVMAYEFGYRAQYFSSLTSDVSFYFNDYDNLRSQERVGTAPVPRVISNKLLAETYGVEVSLKWQPTRRWRVQGSYTYLAENFHLAIGSKDPTRGSQEANDPKHTANLRSHLELPYGLEWDVGLRYVSSLPNPAQPPYFTADTRIAWRFRGQWEFALVGQDLFDNHHPEFGATTLGAHQVQRGVYGSITWEF